MFHNLTFGWFGRVPDKAYGTAEWYRQLWRSSRNFAFVADMTVAVLGGGLKTKQKLTGRLADALSELYLLSCVLKRYEDDGKPEGDRHIVAMCARNGLFRFQEALRGAVDNFPSLPVRWLMRLVVFPLGAHYKPAPDWLGHKCVELVLTPGEVRDRLTRYIYVSDNPNDPTGLLEVDLRQGRRRRDRREEARPRGAGGPGAARARHRLGRRCRQAGRHLRRRGAAAARGGGADGPRHRRRSFRSGRGEAALHDGGPQRARHAERRGRMRLEVP